MTLPNTLEQQLDQIERALDSYVEHGTDHELFIAGYLHGHVSLCTSQLFTQPEPSIHVLNEIVKQSLDEAFANHELADSDQDSVLQMWQQLISRLSLTN